MKSIVTILLMMSMAAYGNTDSDVNYDEYVMKQGFNEVSRVQQFRFNGWQALNNEYLILLSSQNRAYLLELMSPCMDLADTHKITLKQSSKTSLEAKFDKVVVEDQMPDTCTINSIYELTESQHDDILDYSGELIKTSTVID